MTEVLRRGQSPPAISIDRAKEMLAKGRDELTPLRKKFILSNFWFILVPLMSQTSLTPEQKLLVFNEFFGSPYEEELTATRTNIGPAKKAIGASITNYGVEENVLKNAGDFSSALLTKYMGKPKNEEEIELYREFGRSTVKPHIVATKVYQKWEFGIKGSYGKNDNKKEILTFTGLFKRRLGDERQKREMQK